MDRPPVPRTRKEIRHALRGLGVRPSRRFGQNFLADPGALDRIAAASGAGPGESVVEIGAGLGGLTASLAAAGASVLAVEIDPALAAFLRAAFEGEPRVRILEGDALDGRGGLSPALLAALPAGRFLVAANLPYSVATPVVLSLLRREPPPADMVILVQREVADRIRAAPGTEPYGPLSVLVQCAARTARVEAVRKESFHPVPEVASTVIRVTPDPALRRAAGDLDRLQALVFAAFSMRRKTLGNALGKAGIPADRVRAAGVDPSRRAETLSPAEFTALAAALPAVGSREGD
jgi:16S rRNA (adenine1518-N6/adenine1519-N6)-dimethyltransferase